MSMERLLASIREEARERGEAILEEARAEAERIRDEARERVRDLGERRLADVESEARAEAEGAIASARAEAAEARLEARADALERVFGRAAEVLEEGGGGDAYRELARADLGRAAVHVRGLDPVLRCAPLVASLLRDAAKTAELAVSIEEDREAPAGFRIAAADGSVEVDATLVGWLDRLRPELAVEVSRRMAG